MEFKGTKGELELKFVSGVCIGIGTIGLCSQITANTILPETDEEYEKEREEIESNMKIYSCAPETIVNLNISNEMLRSVLSLFGKNMALTTKFGIVSQIEANDKLIKKATTI